MSEPTQEPSVLDYLKSKLNPWQKEKIELPSVELPALPESEIAALSEPPARRNSMRWVRTVLAFALALLGQSRLDVTVKPLESMTILFSVGMYALAFLLLLWAWWLGEFSLPAAPDTSPQEDPQTFRSRPLLAAAVLAILAFGLFGPNEVGLHLFTPLNVTFWLGSIALFLWALWLRNSQQAGLISRLVAFFRQDSWQIKLTRFSLLLLGVIALVVFFRVYRLDAVPAEPFSDHAEKLLDVFDVSRGQYAVFFERNTGREFIQFYWTLLIARVFSTGLTFLSLKIGTVLIGLFALPYIYLLGREVGGQRVAVFALILAGTAYWLNTISRIGLRFPLYPAFTAPVLYYLVRGLRRQTRNDFILAGLFLGLGLHGYSPFRFVPVVVMVAVGLYLLHAAARGRRVQTLAMFLMLVLAALLVFVPLMRYALDRPDMFSYRALTRLAGDHPDGNESPLQAAWQSFFVAPSDPAQPGPGWKIFVENTYKALIMFQYDNGEIWVHSVPHRPALEFVSAALFTLGALFLLVRYLLRRDWLDLFLLLAVPLLLMPSILSLAFPGENPSLNRTGGAAVVVFVIAAQALEGLYQAWSGVNAGGKSSGIRQSWVALGMVSLLLLVSIQQNYRLVFETFATEFRDGAWNTSDMGRVIRAFVAEGNSVEQAWVVPFPYWVDTRLVGIQAG